MKWLPDTKVVRLASLVDEAGKSVVDSEALSKNYRHGHAASGHRRPSATYRTWQSLKRRCSDPRDPSYKNYGARGVTVCQRWADSFVEFLAAMGERPSKLHSIDRIDNSKGYEPGNCRWATSGEQIRNRSITRWITYQGRTQCARDWATEVGMDYTTFHRRLQRGLSGDRLFMPVREKHRSRRRHSEAGAALTPGRLRVLKVYIDVEAFVDQAITRLANHLRKTPDAGLKVQLAGLRGWRDDFKAQRAREGL